MNPIERILDERILVLDGGFGTLLQRLGLGEADFRGDRFRDHPVPLAGDGDALALVRPDVAGGIHAAYFEAGADMVETATFNANRISQADYRLEPFVREMNLAASRIARAAADRFASPGRPRFVAGALGPTNRTASISPTAADPGARAIRFDDLALAYAEQAEALLDGGVDCLLVETIFDTLNAKAALHAIDGVFARTGRRVPVMVSATIADRSGRTLSGQTVEAFLVSIAHARPLTVGFNCALGARDMRPFLEELARLCPFRTSAYPNAGLPNALGGYDETPEETARHVARFAADGLVNVVGGCCGTTPDTIRALAKAVAGLPPRRPPAPDGVTRLAGLEPLEIRRERNFTNVGERTNVAGSRKFARLVREERFEEALGVARAQVENGAQAVDVNVDDPLLDPVAAMTRFLDILSSDPDVARVPVMIDSSRFEVLVAGLKCLQGKAIVNSLSLKDGEAAFVERAREVRRFGAAVVVMCFDEEGQADTVERRVAIAERAYRLLVEQAGFPPEDVTIDANVLAIGTGIEAHRGQGVAFLEAVRRIKALLPGAKTSGGVSNLSFAFRGRDNVRNAIHAVFLRHAVEAGLDMGIVNAGETPPLDDLPADLRALAEDLVLDRRPDATERLVAWAEANPGAGEVAPAARAAATAGLPVAERLKAAIRTGTLEGLEADLAEAAAGFPRALDLIEGPLMAGMAEVGDAFGAGRMFLPQVLKSARVMKKAVEILAPRIEAEKAAGVASAPAGRLLLATVKGDVHDIGKNIVAVVLGCNGVETVDLGVMVPASTILDEAQRRGVDMIGLSGLITPSLDEMTRVAEGMRERGLAIPLLVGGATTSPLHTALRIAPAYPPGVVHVRDASRAVTTVSALLSPERRAGFLEGVAREQAAMREAHGRSRAAADLLPIAGARANAAAVDWAIEAIDAPVKPGRYLFRDVPIAELLPFINWQFFLVAWRLRPWPAILDDPARGAEARRLVDEARRMLDRMAESGLVRPAGIASIHPANADGDDLAVFADETRAREIARFRNLRQQARREAGRPNLCLSDFVAPRASGRADWLGAFAATAGAGVDAFIASLGGDDYAKILARTLADRLAEALAERLHHLVRTDLWGYAPLEAPDPATLFAERYRGIRPAHGYPACPDHTEKRPLLDLLGAGEIGLALTDSCMMVPVASTAGLYFASPRARYFAIDRIGRDQLEDWARRKGLTVDEAERLLARHL